MKNKIPTENNPASLLAKRKWESMSKKERKEHMHKMTKAALKARDKNLSTDELAQGKT